MIYKIIETDLAGQDLENILNYIIYQLKNRTAAKNLLDDIEQRYELLEHNPFMYALCQNSKLNSLGYHKAVIKNYIMIYKIDKSDSIVYIMRFFHGMQNYEELL